MAGNSLKNIEALVDEGGDMTIGGNVLPNDCVATAADHHNCLAMLVRRDGEALGVLLTRPDKAIATAWTDDEFIDEVNG